MQLGQDVDIFWAGPQIHEYPKENQLKYPSSDLHTHGGGPGPALAPISPCVCVDRWMGILIDFP